jgi:MFS family permease
MVSLLSMVIAIAFIAGACYAVVAISAQTQLQEELPEDVRGRVFGVLNMLISVSSLLPIIVVAPAADLVGTAPILAIVSIVVCVSGIASVVRRGPLQPLEATARAGTAAGGAAEAVLPAAQSECAPGTPAGKSLVKPETPR